MDYVINLFSESAMNISRRIFPAALVPLLVLPPLGGTPASAFGGAIARNYSANTIQFPHGWQLLDTFARVTECRLHGFKIVDRSVLTL